jgi:hypothetical protein
MKAILQLQKSKWNEESEGHNDAERDGLAMVGETRETHKGHDYSANNGSADQSSINWIVCWRRGFRRLSWQVQRIQACSPRDARPCISAFWS